MRVLWRMCRASWKIKPFLYNYSGDYRDAPALIGEYYVISCSLTTPREPARGDYNSGVLILKMAVARFLDVSEGETNKVKANAVALIITCVIILKQLFSSGSLNIVEYSPQLRPGDCSTIFISPLVNNCQIFYVSTILSFVEN